jgi:cellobiose phosphorylase
MYRVWIEDVFGFHLRGQRLLVRPELPEDWTSAEIAFRYHSSTYRIKIERVASGRICRVESDGQLLKDGAISLQDDATEHTVTVRIGVSDDPADREGHPGPTVHTAS